MSEKISASIIALASYLPTRVLTNSDLERLVDTSDEWIVSRTGISERRIAAADETTATMGTSASKKLLEKLSRSPDEIDLVLVATMTPDYLAPSTAALVQSSIGAKRAAAFDVQAACSGFLYGLQTARAFIEAGIYKNILFVSSEKMSSFIDYSDRNTCVLFGDGASAAWISAESRGLRIDSVSLGADGDHPFLAWVPAGGTKRPPSQDTLDERAHFFKMEGKELFKHAVRRMSSAAEACLEENGTDRGEIHWVVPHQANARILDAVAKAFEIPAEAVYRTVHKYGNTSASSIPIALDELFTTQKLASGEPILLVAFGAGLTWGAALLRNQS